jgi:hypothetical protein
VGPDAQGNLKLSADDAELHGDQIKTEMQGGQSNIGFWDRGDEWVSWKVQFPKAGVFKASASCASASGGSEFVLEVAGQQASGKAEKTDGWDRVNEVSLGQIEIKQAGEQVVKLRPKAEQTWKALNLRSVKLTPAN